MDYYGTSIPILRGLCYMLHPKRVLEYGAGDYSTMFFLEYVDELVSVEVNPTWQTKRAAHHWVVPDRISPDGFDLVYIDDGDTGEYRLETIHYVLERPHPIVAIHDADIQPTWMKVIQESNEPYTEITDEFPGTTVIWPEENREAELMKTIKQPLNS